MFVGHFLWSKDIRIKGMACMWCRVLEGPDHMLDDIIGIEKLKGK